MSGPGPVRLTLLSRAYCHLCDEMRAALQPFVDRREIVLQELDVDADPALEARWGELVPVLLEGERELCRYRLDRAALEACLAGAGA